MSGYWPSALILSIIERPDFFLGRLTGKPEIEAKILTHTRFRSRMGSISWSGSGGAQSQGYFEEVLAGFRGEARQATTNFRIVFLSIKPRRWRSLTFWCSSAIALLL